MIPNTGVILSRHSVIKKRLQTYDIIHSYHGVNRTKPAPTPKGLLWLLPSEGYVGSSSRGLGCIICVFLFISFRRCPSGYFGPRCLQPEPLPLLMPKPSESMFTYVEQLSHRGMVSRCHQRHVPAASERC